MSEEKSSRAFLPCFQAVAVEVGDEKGRWWQGYWLIAFNSDGFVTALSAATGVVQRLPQDRWRDPVEEMLLASRCDSSLRWGSGNM